MYQEKLYQDPTTKIEVHYRIRYIELLQTESGQVYDIKVALYIKFTS